MHHTNEGEPAQHSEMARVQHYSVTKAAFFLAARLKRWEGMEAGQADGMMTSKTFNDMLIESHSREFHLAQILEISLMKRIIQA